MKACRILGGYGAVGLPVCVPGATSRCRGCFGRASSRHDLPLRNLVCQTWRITKIQYLAVLSIVPYYYDLVIQCDEYCPKIFKYHPIKLAQAGGHPRVRLPHGTPPRAGRVLSSWCPVPSRHLGRAWRSAPVRPDRSAHRAKPTRTCIRVAGCCCRSQPLLPIHGNQRLPRAIRRAMGVLALVTSPACPSPRARRAPVRPRP